MRIASFLKVHRDKTETVFRTFILFRWDELRNARYRTGFVLHRIDGCNLPALNCLCRV